MLSNNLQFIFRITIVLKLKMPPMMKMTKHDLCLLMLHEFKLGYNAFETSTNIKRGRERDKHVIGQYEGTPKNKLWR